MQTVLTEGNQSYSIFDHQYLTLYFSYSYLFESFLGDKRKNLDSITQAETN
jgi:hypothetical protein